MQLVLVVLLLAVDGDEEAVDVLHGLGVVLVGVLEELELEVDSAVLGLSPAVVELEPLVVAELVVQFGEGEVRLAKEVRLLERVEGEHGREDLLLARLDFAWWTVRAE